MSRYIFIFLLICSAFAVTFQDGYNRFVRGEYKEAVDVFSVLLSQKPSDFKTTLWLGKSYYYLGDKKRAIDILIKATRLNPKDTEAKELLEQIEHVRGFKKIAEANYHKGYFSYIKSDYTSAKEYYWQAILLDPEVSKYHLWHLRSLIGLGELNEARAQLEFAEKLKPYDNALSVLKSEDLRDVTADMEYYNLLVSLKDKKTIKPVKQVEQVSSISVTQQPELVPIPKQIVKVIELPEKKEIDNTDFNANKPIQVPSDKKIKEIILSKNVEFQSEIPTLNAEMLRKEAASYQGSTTKIRYSF